MPVGDIQWHDNTSLGMQTENFTKLKFIIYSKFD